MMYSNNILNFQESMTILNACTKKVWKLFEGTSYISQHTSELQFTIWEPLIKNITFIFEDYIFDRQ